MSEFSKLLTEANVGDVDPATIEALSTLCENLVEAKTAEKVADKEVEWDKKEKENEKEKEELKEKYEQEKEELKANISEHFAKGLEKAIALIKENKIDEVTVAEAKKVHHYQMLQVENYQINTSTLKESVKDELASVEWKNKYNETQAKLKESSDESTKTVKRLIIENKISVVPEDKRKALTELANKIEFVSESDFGNSIGELFKSAATSAKPNVTESTEKKEKINNFKDKLMTEGNEEQPKAKDKEPESKKTNTVY